MANSFNKILLNILVAYYDLDRTNIYFPLTFKNKNYYLFAVTMHAWVHQRDPAYLVYYTVYRKFIISYNLLKVAIYV